MQEDFWVRREMLVIVYNTLSNIALFQEEKVDPKEKLPPGILGRRVFKNASWQLNLLFVKAARGLGWEISPLSTIKNISASKKTQPLAVPGSSGGLPFQLLQDGAQYTMRIAGEPLAFDKEMPLSKTPISTVPVDLRDPKKALYIEQKLIWEISPIRRIDRLALAAHSHRTITSGLKIREDLKMLDPEPKDDAPPAAAGGAGSGLSGSGAPGGGPKGASMGSGGAGGASGGQDKAAEDLTPVNKINRARYLHVTPQCRHLPIAMRIVLDQSHIHDFLAAFANSRLRIQTTQVLFQHARDVKRHTEASPSDGSSGAAGGAPAGGAPPGGPSSAGGAGSGRAGGPASPMSGSGVGRPPSGGFGGSSMGGSAGGMPRGAGGSGFGGQGFSPGQMGSGSSGGGNRSSGGGAADSAGKAPAFQDNARLVELTVYGVATLYERYPPREKPKTTTPAK